MLRTTEKTLQPTLNSCSPRDKDHDQNHRMTMMIPAAGVVGIIIIMISSSIMGAGMIVSSSSLSWHDVNCRHQNNNDGYWTFVSSFFCNRHQTISTMKPPPPPPPPVCHHHQNKSSTDINHHCCCHDGCCSVLHRYHHNDRYNEYHPNITIGNSNATTMITDAARPHSQSTPSHHDGIDNNIHHHHSCRIYLAPTSLKIGNDPNHHRHYGIYTTEYIAKGDKILQGMDGPNIPIIDYHLTSNGYYDHELNHHFYHPTNNNNTYDNSHSRYHFMKVWDHYWWGRGISYPVLKQESNTNHIMDYQIMFGSLPNTHCALQGIDSKFSSSITTHYRDNDRQHHGAGAYSYYTGRDFYASWRDLQPGDEIFLNYGYCHRRNYPIPEEEEEEEGNADEDEDDDNHHNASIVMIPMDGTTDIHKMNHHDYNGSNLSVTTSPNITTTTEPDWIREMFKEDDFLAAAAIFKRLYQRYQRSISLKGKDTTENATFAISYPQRLRHLIRRYNNTEGGRDVHERVNELLPSSFAEFIQFTKDDSVEAIIARHHHDTNKRTLKRLGQLLAKHYDTEMRSVDWIRQNGYCLENLIGNVSTIPHAGYGAFLQTSMIRTGEVIVPSPMLHIVHGRDDLTIYDIHGNKRGTQLLMNYCLGHPESTLLLCPTTNAILINHCSSTSHQSDDDDDQVSDHNNNRSCEPNAEYRWMISDPSTHRWSQMSLEEMIQHVDRGITMEVIATRDIYYAEEVFIDYGPQWEMAWLEHVAQWKQRHSEEVHHYYSIQNSNQHHSMNDTTTTAPPLAELVSGNLRTVVYSDIIQTVCVFWEEGENDEYEELQEDDVPMMLSATTNTPVDRSVWYEWDNDEDILDAFAIDGDKYVLDAFADHTEESYYPCSILMPEDDHGEYYTVRIYNNDGDNNNNGKNTANHHEVPSPSPRTIVIKDFPRIITGYPKESILFLYRPYQTDQSWIHAFRHPIGIRDEIFPDSWKNLRR